tara:strand:- start:2189 stop:2563 length:375 start_codon:yes stop_codon:yes gene_type:complete
MLTQKPNLINPNLRLQLNCKSESKFTYFFNLFKKLKNLSNINVIISIGVFLCFCFICFYYKSSSKNIEKENKDMEKLYRKLKLYKRNKKKKILAERDNNLLNENIELQEKINISGYNNNLNNTY